MELIVTGMHRSGTSAVTAALHKLTESPTHQELYFKGDKFNRDGYYELRDVVICNEKILSQVVLEEYNHLRDITLFKDFETLDQSGWFFGAFANFNTIENQQCLKLAKKSFEDIKVNGNCIIKDPRFSLTLPVWLSVFRKPVILIMIRNPIEVAQSLFQRNGIPNNTAFQLWESYSFRAEWNSRAFPRIFVDYGALTSDPSNTIEEIREFLVNNGIDSKTESTKKAIDMIKPELRKQRGNEDTNDDSGHIMRQYYRLRSLCKTSSTLTNHMHYPHENLLESTCNIGISLALQQQLRMSQFNENERIRAVSQLERLNQHIVVGSIIRLFRFLKKDPTFGETKL